MTKASDKNADDRTRDLEPGESRTQTGKIVSEDDPEIGPEPVANPYTENEGGGRNQQNAFAHDAGEEVPADKLPISHPDSDLHEEVEPD